MIWSIVKSVCFLQKQVFKVCLHEMRTANEEYQKVKKPDIDWGFKRKSPEEEAKKSEALMPIEEAINILQVPPTFTTEEVEQRFDKLFKLNDPAKGGSFFIQCKVKGAKITLIKHIEAQTAASPVDSQEPTKENDSKPVENKESTNN